MFEGKGEFVKGSPKIQEAISLERMRPDLVKAIGKDAVEFVENRGLTWIYSREEGPFDSYANRASYQDGNHFVTVGEWVIDMEDDGSHLVGVYRKGESIPLVDQYLETRKTGVQASFSMLGGEFEGQKAYTAIGDKLSSGSIGFLRELVGFASLIENNVFLFPTDNRRQGLYKAFFTGNKFDNSFRGTYFLFQPKPE